MSNPYKDFCDTLWRSWLDGRLELPPSLRVRFDLNASPEPYLPFGAGARPLVVLTTNPGATMRHQRRSVILRGNTRVAASSRYEDVARRLGRYYSTQLSGQARYRIDALTRLAKWAGFDGYVQVECCPFHSSRLAKKASLVKEMAEGSILTTYTRHLLRFLRTRPVLILSAVGTHRPVTAQAVRRSPWLQWQADLVGLAVAEAEFVQLVSNGRSPTGALLIDRTGTALKALLLMMGGNHLPAEAGLRKLAGVLLSATD